MKMDCWYKDKNGEKESTMVAEEKEVSNLFMAQCEHEGKNATMWIVDSRCSNHMSGTRELLSDLSGGREQKINGLLEVTKIQASFIILSKFVVTKIRSMLSKIFRVISSCISLKLRTALFIFIKPLVYFFCF